MSRPVRRIVLGPARDFAPGTSRRVDVEGRPIAVFNVDGRYFALKDVCPHQGAALSDGPVVGRVSADEPGCFAYDGSRKRVRCPWHGWEYDLQTGQSSFDPAHNRVRQYPVAVEAGGVVSAQLEPDDEGRVNGPYVAETFEVSVEQDYLIIEL